MAADGPEKHDRTPVWRNPSWIAAIGTLLGSIAAIAALVVTRSGDESSTLSTSDEEQTTVTTTLVDGYWTSDGTQPTRSQTCFGVLGTCLNQPIDAVSDALGPSDNRYSDEAAGTITNSWDLGPGGVSFKTDNVDAIVEAHVGGTGNFRAALPEDWTLGEFSLRDVTDSEGSPSDVEVFGGEGITIVIVAYCTGPEGSLTVEYSLDVSWEDEISSSINNANAIDLVGDRAVTSYAVRQRGVSGVTETC